MSYELALWISLAIFLFGLCYKISGWFRFTVDDSPLSPSTSNGSRLGKAIKGIAGSLLSRKLVPLASAFFKDVLLQLHILKEDRLRWLMHILIFAGFSFLFFFHALDRFIVTPIHDPFYLTLNPFLLIPGCMVLAGVGIAVYRRQILKVPRLKTTPVDRYALAIITAIILTGMVMELMKLASYTHHQKFWNIHVYACLFGLAYLPFSKLFHMFTTPLSLMANAVMDSNSDPANIRTRQMMELDACTRCGTCSNRCSVAVAFDSIGNTHILPSERMEFLKDYFADKDIGSHALGAIQQGIFLCTNCDRCTVSCPAGINLRELWFDTREEIVQKGAALHLVMTPFSYFRGLNQPRLAEHTYGQPQIKAAQAVGKPYGHIQDKDAPIEITSLNQVFKDTTDLSDTAHTYAACFACENCSTVCPVVGEYADPQDALDLLPHQIMRSMGFGIKDLSLGSKMLWYCLTCYQCQEHCPQGVKVTDILFELKNKSVETAG